MGVALFVGVASPFAGCSAPAGDVATDLGGPEATLADAMAGEGGTWVDLTYSFSENTTYWPTAEGFRLDTVAFGPTEGGYFYSAFNFSAAEHGGTHLDAPIHFSEGRLATDEIPIDQLIGAATMIDVSTTIDPDDGPPDPDYQVTREDLEAWESRNSRLSDGTILLLRTGWSRHYGDRSSYLGTDLVGPDAVPELHFPGLHPDAARWLVAERSIKAFGIDTPSIDYGQSSLFETHQVIYGANIPGFENVANLERIPATGSFVVALPMKIEGGSGGPLRIVAFVPDGM